MTLADSMADAGESGQALLEQLCEVSIALWKGRLRENVTVEDCGSAFICAAALSTYCLGVIPAAFAFSSIFCPCSSEPVIKKTS